MRETMNKLTHGATRLLVLAFGLGLALTGWAAVKPLVVWNGDFPTSNDGTSTRNGYRLSVKGNTAANDGSKITLKSSNNLGVEVVHVDANGNMTVAKTPFAAVYNIYNITTSGSRMFGTSIANNGGTPYYNRTMAGLSDTTFKSWHSGGSGGSEQLSGTFSGNSTTKYSIGFLYRPTGSTGTDLYLNGTHVMQADGIKWSTDANNVYGVALGGCAGAETRWNFPGAEISYVAILNSADETDIAAWSLNGLTASATFADGGTISSGTDYSTTGINLNGGTITVSGEITAAAIFIQADTTLSMAAGTDKLVSTGPVYIADGVTLRINVTGNPSTYTEGTASSADLITGTLYVSDTTIEAGTLAAVSRGKAGIETDTANNKIQWTYKPMPVWSNGSWAGGIAPTASDEEIAIDSSASATYNAGNVPETYTTVYVIGNGTLSVGENGLKVTTLNVAADATVNMANITATTVTGEGTVIYDNIALVATDAAWHGTVWIKNCTFTGIDLNTYGNEHSLIKLTSTSGTLANGLICAVPVELVDDGSTPALNLVYGTNPGALTYTFSDLRGGGTFKTTGTAWPEVVHRVLKWNSFTGSLYIDRGRFIFGSGTFSEYRNICVSANASVEVPSGKTWYAYRGYEIGAGATLTVAGDISYGAADDSLVVNAVSGSGTVVFSGKAPSPTGGKWWTTSGWTGTVWIKNLSVANFNGNLYGNANSTLKLSGVSGYFPASSDCVVPIELSNSGYNYGLYVTDGFSRSDSAPDNVNVIRELKGDGEMWTGNNGDNVWFNVRKWSGFTGKIQLVNKIVVFGDDVPAVGDFNTAGSIYVRQGKTVTIASGKQWRADGGIYLEGELQADGVSTTTFNDSTIITTYDTGVFTLVNSNSTQDQSQSYARITGTGTLRYANASGWRTLSRSNFPTNMICEINLKPGVILQAANNEHTIGSLAGDGRIRSDWGGSDNVGDRDLKILQAKDTEYSGSFDDGTSASSWDRLRDVIVAPGISTSGTLTLSGTQTADNGLKILSSAKAKVTGKWKGSTTVTGSLAFGGANGTKIDGAVTTVDGAVLDFTDFTVGEASPISGVLTLDANTTIRFPTGVEFPYTLADSIAGVSSLAAGKYTVGGVAGTVPLLFSDGKAYTKATGTFAGGAEPIAWGDIDWGGVTPIYGSEVEVTVSASGTLTLGTLMDKVGAMKATFNVPAGMELTLTGMIETGEIWFKGNGTVVCNEATTLIGVVKGDSTITVKYPKHTLPAATARWTDSDWKGMLVLEDCGRGQNANYPSGETHGVVRFDQYGSAYSTIRAPGYVGISAVANQNTTCLATLLVDSGDVVEFNHGTGESELNTNGAGFRFAKLAGTGTLRLDGTSDTAQYIFNDVDDFEGTVEITFPAEGGRKSFLFGAPSGWDVMNSAYAANLVILGDMTVAAGKTWDVPAGVIIAEDKTLTLSSGATVKALSKDSEGTIKVPNGTSVDAVTATLQGITNSVFNGRIEIGEYATLNITDPSLTSLTIPADSTLAGEPAVARTYSNAGLLDLSGCTSLTELHLVLGEAKTFDFTKVRLPSTCKDIYYDIGDKRDLTGYSLPGSNPGSATSVSYYATETEMEYANGGFVVSNVTAGTVWLIRQNGALIKTAESGTDRTYQGGRSFAGAACWHEWDFEQSNLEDRLKDTGRFSTNEVDASSLVPLATVAAVSGSDYATCYISVQAENKRVLSSAVYPNATLSLGDVWSAAVRCSMPTVTGDDKAVAIAFGDTSTGVLGLASAANGFVELFNWTNGVYTTLAQLKVESPSDLNNMHIYVLAVTNDTTSSPATKYVSLYRDGEFIHAAKFACNGAIEKFMVGNVADRGEAANLPAAVTSGNAGYVDYLRLYDKVIPESDVTGLSLRRPFVSAIDAYERTETLIGHTWSETDAWTLKPGNNGATTTATVPAAGKNVTFAVDGQTGVSLNLDADVKYGTLIFAGSGDVGLAQIDTGKIGAEMFVVRRGVNLTVDYNAVNLTNAVVGVDQEASLKFDFSAFPFETVTATTNIVLAGTVPATVYDDTCTNRYSIVLPDALPNTIASAVASWDGVSYKVTITPDHTAGDTVYYKEGVLTEGMTVYREQALENATTLFPGDTLVISEASATGDVEIDDLFNGNLSVSRAEVNLTSAGNAALAGKTVSVADNCALNFAGGSFGAMTLVGPGSFAFAGDTAVVSLSGTVGISVANGKTLTVGLVSPFVSGGVSGKGTVKLPAVTGGLDFNSFGNSDSTVELISVTDGVLANNGTCNPTLLLDGAAAFASVDTYTFTKIAGVGNLTFPAASVVTISELEDYDGTIVNNSSVAVTVTKLTKTDGVYVGGAVLLTKGGSGSVDVAAVEISGVEKQGFWDGSNYCLAGAEYNNQMYATVAAAITAAGDENLFYITVFDTTETLPPEYMFVEEMGVTKVVKKSIVEIGAATFEYGADYTNATVRVAVTETNASGVMYTLTVGGKPYVATASGGVVTFDDVEVPRGAAYGTVGYEIISTANTTTGDTSGSAPVATTTAWINENSATHGQAIAGGAWTNAEAVTYSGEGKADISDNRFAATEASTSSRVVLEFEVCFSSACEDDVSGDAQAAIKLGDGDNGTTFMVLTTGKEWTSVSNAKLLIDASETYTVVLTIDYGTNTYKVDVDGNSMTNSAGVASFALAMSTASVQNIDFAGSGTLTSLKGDQLEGYMVKDALNNFYATIEAAIQAYNSANGPYTVLHEGTTPSGWKIVNEGGVDILKKIARGLFIIAY